MTITMVMYSEIAINDTVGLPYTHPIRWVKVLTKIQREDRPLPFFGCIEMYANGAMPWALWNVANLGAESAAMVVPGNGNHDNDPSVVEQLARHDRSHIRPYKR